MGSSNRLRYALGGALVALLGVAGPLAAQATGTIRGRVVEGATQRPLVGASVSIPGAQRSAVTDNAGNFTLGQVPAGTVSVRAATLGYTPAVQSVTVAAGQTVTVNFSLASSAIDLEGLIVTGTPGAVQRRTIGNAVSTVNAEEITEVSPATTVTQLLQGRSPGLTIMPPSGTPGTAGSIRIRGTGSYNAGNFPIFYVDGVRFNAGSQGGYGVGGQSTSALDAINPEDIESIEVIKGPAAATLYGAEAAAGVIQIITKKGRTGQQSIDFDVKVEYGQDDFNVRTPTNFATCTQARVALATWPGCQGQPVGTKITANPLREPGILRDGGIFSYSGNARGGGERFSFYISGDREENDGVFQNSYFDRTTGRGNFQVTPSDALNITTSASYTKSYTRLPNNDNSSWGWLRNSFRGTPGFFNPASSYRVNWAGLGPDQMALYDNVTRAERWILSTTVNYQPFSWFRNRLTGGLDAGTRRASLFFPIDLTGRSPYGAIAAKGTISQYEPNTRNWTLDYAGTITPALSGDFSADLSFGMQLNAYRFDSLEGYGEGLTSNQTRLISNAQITDGFESFEERNSLGLYVQQQVGWRNRLFLTGAVRVDDNSTFGEDFSYETYPKASLSWVVSEEPFFGLGFVDQLKLRAAWGQAGNSPASFSADQTYSPSSLVLDQSTFAPAVRTSAFGNPDLRAEKGEEIEIGFDLGMLGDRVALEATYFDKTTNDALLGVPVPASSGFTGTRLQNVGEISNRGVEFLLSVTPVESPNFTWESQVSFSAIDNEFVSFGGTRDEPILLGYGGGVQWVEEGYPLGAYWGQRPRRNADGTLLLVNGQPQLDPERYNIGPSVPSREASLSTTMTLFRNVRLYAFADYKGGHYLYNFTEQTRTSDGNNYYANFLNPANNPNAAQLDPTGERWLLARFGGHTPWIEEADFVKLREVAATYFVPRAFARRMGADDVSVTFAGRNLMTWTKYSGMDPEVNIEGPATFTRADYMSVPPLRRFVATVNVRF